MNRAQRSLFPRALLLGVAFSLLSGAAFAINIEVNYGSGFYDLTFGAKRREAFAAAAQVWENALSGNVTVKIDASFDSLGGGATWAVLGGAGPLSANKNFDGAPRANTWYVASLADQLAGSDLYPGVADIQAQFNGDVDGNSVLGTIHWYYGTDGNPPGNDIDFFSTVLHELGHGLGYLSLMDQDGSWLSSTPDIFSVYLNRPGVGDLVNLTTSQRGSALVSNNLWWQGPAVVAEHGDLVKMFAPNPYEPGSSVSHWDTSNSPDLLMEPYDTGPNHTLDLTVQAFEDIGWPIAASASLAVSKTAIDLGVSLNSATFQVWNSGAGAMNYTLSVASGQAYFSVGPAGGASSGPGDPVTHTVTVDRNAIGMNQSVGGSILITSAEASNSPITINLVASRGAPNPSLGLSDTMIDLGASLDSETFDVWNTDGGTMNYTLSIVSGGAYFSVLPASGSSSNPNERITHTVTLDRSAIGIGQSVDGAIRVTSPQANNSPLTIDLAATRSALSPPPGLSASEGLYSDRVSVSWNQALDATHYRVFRAPSETGEFTALSDWQTLLTYDDSTASPLVTYYYRVSSALDDTGMGESAQSASAPGWVNTPVAAPLSMAASYNGYVDFVRVTCSAVADASHYRFFRSDSPEGMKQPLGEWQSDLMFTDTSGQAGVEFTYWVQAASSSEGDRAGLFTAAAGRRPALREIKDFKVTFKRSALTVEDGTRLILINTDFKSTIKIKMLKKPPGNPKYRPGTTYLRAMLLPEVIASGSLKKISTDVPIRRLIITGVNKSIVAKNCWIESVNAHTLGSVKMTAVENVTNPLSPAYATTDIFSSSRGMDGMKVQLNGVILERLSAQQKLKSLRVSSKKHKAEGAPGVSLGGIGRITEEAFLNSEQEYSITVSESGGISAKGCSIRPDKIDSYLEIGAISAKPKSLNGILFDGFLGVPEQPERLRVYGTHIKSLFGGSGVSGIFIAGYDEFLQPTFMGGIKSIGMANTGASLSGAAYVSPLAKPIRFKPGPGTFEVYTTN